MLRFLSHRRPAKISPKIERLPGSAVSKCYRVRIPRRSIYLIDRAPLRMRGWYRGFDKFLRVNTADGGYIYTCRRGAQQIRPGSMVFKVIPDHALNSTVAEHLMKCLRRQRADVSHKGLIGC